MSWGRDRPRPHRSVLAVTGSLTRLSPEQFTAFDRAEFVPAAWNFHIAPRPDGRCTLTTETRVRATDDRARRAFSRYWGLVGR